MDIPRNLGQTTRDVTNRIAPQLESMREGLAELNDRAVDTIKRRPVASILGALAIGYVIGRIVSRF